MEYQDFKIRISSAGGGQFKVGVESPAGEARADFELPFTVESFLDQLNAIGGLVRGETAAEPTREVEIDQPAPPDPSEIGAALYDALFVGNVSKAFYTSLGQVSAANNGLRIKLLLDLTDDDVRKFAQLPWEFMCSDQANGKFLNLSVETPIVRYIEASEAQRGSALTDELRVLVVLSNPDGVAQLDLEQETEKIKASWGQESKISADYLHNPTASQLLDELTNNDYHVIHYMGHGTPTGLILSDEQGHAEVLESRTMGIWLGDLHSLKLVFLNACDTAKVDDDSPVAGVATRLVAEGLPAVVAMQFPITDRAAIEFSRSFYKLITTGAPVDQAVAHARKAILGVSTGTLEWATPVLFMRAPEGRLFSNSEDVAYETNVQVDKIHTPEAEVPEPEPSQPDEPATVAASAATSAEESAPTPAPPKVASEPPTTSGINTRLIGIAAGVLVVIGALIAYLAWPEPGIPAFDPPEATVYLGQPHIAYLRIDPATSDDPIAPADYDDFNPIDLSTNMKGMTPTRLGDKLIERQAVIPISLEATPDGDLSGELIATLLNGTENPIERKLKIKVKVSKDAQTALNKLNQAFADGSVSNVDLAQSYNALNKDFYPRDVQTEIDEKVTTLEELETLKNAVTDLVQTGTLSERKTAFDAYAAEFKSSRGALSDSFDSAFHDTYTALPDYAGSMVVCLGQNANCSSSAGTIPRLRMASVRVRFTERNGDDNFKVVFVYDNGMGSVYKTIDTPAGRDNVDYNPGYAGLNESGVFAAQLRTADDRYIIASHTITVD